MKHEVGQPQGAVRLSDAARRLPARDQIGQRALERERPAPAVLRILAAETNDAARKVHVAPRHRRDFALPLPGVVPERHGVAHVVGKVRGDGLEIRALKKAGARVALGQAPNGRRGGDPLPRHSEPEGLPEDLRFAVDRRRLVRREAVGHGRRLSPPDAVLLDILMPGMDGVQVLRAMRALDASIPVVSACSERSQKH